VEFKKTGVAVVADDLGFTKATTTYRIIK